jgi:4-hydroxy-2-oxoheptanedioate aldolase
MRENTVKRALREGRAQGGTWLSLASPIAARYIARCGYPWVTLDLEHSPANWETAATIFGFIADVGGVPLARIAVNDLENAKHALDSGAWGIVFPMVNSVEEAREAVSSCKYPPEGRRSVGGSLQALSFGATSSDYFARANDEILIILQAEHIRAVENCEAIFSVPGVDGMFVGPNDLLASMGKKPAMDSDDPEFVAALRRLRETADACGIAPGIHVGDAETAVRREAEGWRFIAVSSELGFMLDGAEAAARKAVH